MRGNTIRVPYGKIEVLMARLLRACQRLPDMGGDLFSRGQEVIERKFGCVLWLSSFIPSDAIENEKAEATVNIKHEGWITPAPKEEKAP